MGLDTPSRRRSAMDITLAIRINSLAVFFNADAVTEWGHLATTLRFTTKGYIQQVTQTKIYIHNCVFLYLYLHIHEG